jgi:hypothetical protein
VLYLRPRIQLPAREFQCRQTRIEHRGAARSCFALAAIRLLGHSTDAAYGRAVIHTSSNLNGSMRPDPIQAPPDADQQRRHAEFLLDDALADTFPCSDPVSTLFFDDPQVVLASLMKERTEDLRR